MIKILGARRFIDSKTGTFYISYWLDNENECLEKIKELKRDKIFDFEYLEIFGDNGGSMSFDKDEEDFINYYDANVVGDASPGSTIYVTFDFEDLPEMIKFYDFELTKNKILEIRNIFIECDTFNRNKEHYNWAINELDKLFKEGNKVINIEEEI